MAASVFESMGCFRTLSNYSGIQESEFRMAFINRDNYIAEIGVGIGVGIGIEGGKHIDTDSDPDPD
jgi:hypothetical protein